MIGFISVILFLCSMMGTTQAEIISMKSAKDTAVIASIIDELFFLSDVSYDCDTGLLPGEFNYVTGLKKGHTVCGQHLMRAVTHLFKKNCFDRIDLSVEGEQEKTVHFSLHGFWRFEKLKVSGVWVGKEWYKQQYLMESGDRFDEETHHHAVQKIKDACRLDGYFNIQINSSCMRNEPTKGVTVNLTITRGKRFSIGRTHLTIEHDEGDDTDCALVRSQIEKRFFSQLKRSKYSKKHLDEQARAIKKFLADQGFLHVSIDLHEELFKDRDFVDLHWTINVRKKREFLFFGNHFFSNAELLDQIFTFGRSAWIVPASILAQEIQEAYQRDGFWQAEVEGKDEQDRSFFSIKEGKRAQLASIAFTGATAFPERQIMRRCFATLKRKRYVDRQSVDVAYDLLTDLYLKNGYLDVTIEPPSWRAVNESGDYQLIVTVHESAQKLIHELSIPGYESLEQQGPFAPFCKLKKGMPYDAGIVAQQKRWLTDHFSKQGYLYPSITSEHRTNDERSVLVWHIERGEEIHFGKTIIQGANLIAHDKIMAHLGYQEGELWDQEKIRHSFLRLKELQLFDSIAFSPLPKTDQETERALLLKLHNDDPFELRVRAGLEFQHIRQYQTFAGVAYKLGATFMVKNPSNNGDLFRFDADVARSHREVNFKYQYPRLFATPLDGLLHTYAIKYEQPGYIGSKRNLYTLYQHGFLLGLRHKNRYIDMGLNVGFEVGRTTFNNDDLSTKRAAIQLANAINFDPRLLNHNIPYIFLEPTILIDLLDNNLYPTTGTFSLMSFKGMFPINERFSDSYFIKMLLEHSWFVSIRRSVAAFRVRFGHIFHRDFSDIMPNERFYLGGSHSIRSYETDLAPPIGLFTDDEGKEHLVPRGGKTMLNFNAELRLPVARKISAVLFQDLGILCGESFEDFCTEKLVAGTGFGIRYHTPIGPLRFDVGWKWKRCSSLERSYNWILTFGQAF